MAATNPLKLPTIFVAENRGEHLTFSTLDGAASGQQWRQCGCLCFSNGFTSSSKEMGERKMAHVYGSLEGNGSNVWEEQEGEEEGEEGRKCSNVPLLFNNDQQQLHLHKSPAKQGSKGRWVRQLGENGGRGGKREGEGNRQLGENGAGIDFQNGGKRGCSMGIQVVDGPHVRGFTLHQTHMCGSQLMKMLKCCWHPWAASGFLQPTHLTISFVPETSSIKQLGVLLLHVLFELPCGLSLRVVAPVKALTHQTRTKPSKQRSNVLSLSSTHACMTN